MADDQDKNALVVIESPQLPDTIQGSTIANYGQEYFDKIKPYVSKALKKQPFTSKKIFLMTKSK